MLINKIVVLFIFGTLHLMSAQSAGEVFEKYIEQNNKLTSYKVKIVYEMYRGKNIQPFEITQGEKKYTPNGFYERIDKVENVIGKGFHAQINHEEKVLYYSPNAISYKASENFDISVLEPFFDLSPLNEVNNGKEFKLVFQLKNSIEDFQYSQIEFYIDKSTYNLKRQVFYTSAVVNFSAVKGKPEFDTQRLEIKYSNYQNIDFKNNKGLQRFESSTYVKAIGSGEDRSYNLQPRYTSYQLLVGN